MTTSRYDRVRQLLINSGARRYRFEQFTRAVFSQGVDHVDQITTLPSALRQAIAAEIGGSVVALQPDRVERTDQASKVRFRLADGTMIETVQLRYRAGWTSLCISSQAGCGYGCAFCATASMGLRRQLSVDEITDQVLWFRHQSGQAGRVAFMGMGEPLANAQVIDALDILLDPALFAYSPRRITVSTVGMRPGLERLLAAHPDVGITFSLHAAIDTVRRRLVPLEDRFPAVDVLERLDRHIRHTGREVTLACALIDGVNDRDDDIDALIGLVRDRAAPAWRYHVNLYPLNPSLHIDGDLRPSRRVRAVHDRLRSAGLRTSIRAQFGTSIAAGCGQLATSNRVALRRPTTWRAGVTDDIRRRTPSYSGNPTPQRKERPSWRRTC